MTTRRDSRQTHVRPRPPSTGRPAPIKARPRAPTSTRLAVHRPIERDRGLPIVAKLGLLAAVALLGLTVLYLGVGGLGSVVGGISASLGGFITSITAVPTPKPSVIAVSDPPTMQQPAEPYTAETTVDLVVTVPSEVAGDQNSRIRVYLALKDQAPTPIQEAPLAATPQTVIPVELTKGINDFSVTIVGPGGESDPSPVVRYVLDQAPAKITISSPKEGAVVNGLTVEINGKTQGRTTLVARNAANGSSITSSAGSDGLFTLNLPLSTGTNEITITGTDPAGNVKELTLTVRRGSGQLTAVLGASAYKLSVAKLPQDLTLTASASDPDGNPVVGADITFTLSIPGIPTVTADMQTDDQGRATFTTAVPEGADSGQGSATILLSSEEFGSTQDYTVITIEP
ncbi:MAG: hypothetical protein Q7S35_00695 [Candidatus Limnocylindrales bacterium]|nr:hypothetical protein [Candidatus Limnocylindrales bacterium]